MIRQRNWGISNSFSESHRKFLPGNYCLWDIDGFLIDDNNSIIGIYEGKYKMTTRDKGDFIKTFYEPKNLQAGFLRCMSDKMQVWIHEESTRKWWKIEDGYLKDSKDPDVHLIKTENKVYVEDILKKTINLHNPVGVFLRTEGKKQPDNLIYAEWISNSLGIEKVLVNDVLREESIFFKRKDRIVECLIKEDENSWLKEWSMLGIN